MTKTKHNISKSALRCCGLEFFPCHPDYTANNYIQRSFEIYGPHMANQFFGGLPTKYCPSFLDLLMYNGKSTQDQF